MPQDSIKVCDLSKCFAIYERPADRIRELFSKQKHHREFWALNGVSLAVQGGETVGVIGRNGSGKSTLLKIIAGILRPTSGSREVNGRVASLLELGAGFNPELTGRENIFINGAIQGFSRSEMEERFASIVNFAELGEFIEVPVKKYSSGMFVRLAFSCAINIDPEILIVDEALSVGDELFQRKCFLKLEAFQKLGKTILFVSHSSPTIKQLCNRAVLLEGGKVAAEGDPNSVVNEYSRILFGKTAVKTPAAPATAKMPTTVSADSATQGRAILSSSEKSEYRYGNNQAEIIEHRVLDSQLREADTIECGAECTIELRVRFKALVSQPIYALTIKNVQGLEVYGTNSWFKQVGFEARGPGDDVLVRFQQRVNLTAGNYYLSFGCVALEGEELIPLDRRYDAALLKVLPIDRDFGVAYLDSAITVERKEKEGVGNG